MKFLKLILGGHTEDDLLEKMTKQYTFMHLDTNSLAETRELKYIEEV